MRSKFAAAALATLLYAQGLLGFAAVATVLIDRAGAAGEPDPLVVSAVR
ncbi:hypothetical protein [Arvimicrobium flavum]|nr:hypothetical protein [Mesorhizobium shangrilense]